MLRDLIHFFTPVYSHQLAEMMGLEDDDEPAPAEVPNTDYNDGIDYNNNEDDDEETDDGML